MGKSCTYKPCCRNLNGEVVESKLFKDLLHYTSNNRPVAVNYYGIGTNKRFLEEVKDDAKFDENGEITIGSLKKLAKLDFKEDVLLKTLNEEIKSGIGTYEEVISRLQDFNRNSSFNEDYMATIKSVKDGKYELSVVKRTLKNEESLNEEIAHRNLRDRLIYHLNKNGVNVSFLEESSNINGRYSTVNAEKTADGLYSLITLLDGKEIESNLAEEAGHFAVGALGNDPLVERLIKLLTPEVQKQILGDEYETKVLGSNPSREVAGYLVGKALNKETINDFPGKKLLNRIVNKLKKIFYNITGDDVKMAKLQAEIIAEDIANGFMSPSFTGNIENALAIKETLFSADETIEQSAYKDAVRALKHTVETLKSRDVKFADSIEEILKDVEKHQENASNTDSAFLLKGYALSGLTEAVVRLQSVLENDVPQLLDDANTADFKYTFYKDLPRNAKNLVTVRTIVNDTLTIIDAINKLNIPRGEKITIENSAGVSIDYDLKGTADALARTLQEGQINERLVSKERDLFLNFLKKILGRDSVEMASRVVFNVKNPTSMPKSRWDKYTRKIRDVKLKSLVRLEKGGKISLENMLLYLQRDSSLFERYLASASNSNDVILQICDKYVKQKNKLADDKINNIQDRLRVLQSKLKNDLGLKRTDIFMEVSNRENDKKGHSITGNIVSPLCWGDYEEDFKEFKEQCEREFFEANPNIANLPETTQAIYWSEYFTPRVKAWHKGGVIQDANGNDVVINAHSQWDKENKKYIPSVGITTKKGYKSENYKSNQYEKLTEDQKAWLKEYMELKEELDSYLPQGSTLSIRAPQFKGTFTNRVQNRKLNISGRKAFGKTLKESIRSTFYEDFDDTELGSNLTVNVVDNNSFGNELEFEKAKVDRIPLYGINKLKKMDDLSTDLFNSTLAYASMAISYSTLNDAVDILEVGRSSLSRRVIEGMNETQRALQGRNNSNAFARYKTFLDKQIYGLGAPRYSVGKVVINKVCNFITGLGSKMFLYGNVVGGMVNVGTGLTELIKEALAGEFYDFKDFKAANRIYFSSLVPNLIYQNSRVTKDDKLSLLLRHFNIQGDSRQRQREWSTRTNRGVNFLKKVGWAPYRNGDNYMQSISYLAIFNRTKLYDINGKELKMEDAYDYDSIIDENGVSKEVYGKTLKIKDELFFTSKEKLEEYKFNEELLNKVQEAIDNDAIYDFTDEELKYLRSKDWVYNNTQLDLVKDRLINNMKDLKYGAKDESDIMNKAREISNRLHGIYNNQDKVGANQNIITNMFLSMKGYALGMIERRFGSEKYNVILDQNVEGSIKTAIKAAAMMNHNLANLNLREAAFYARCLAFPFHSKSMQAELVKRGFSDNQYRNLRRNALDNMFILALRVLRLLTGSLLSGDDDDDDDVLIGNADYLFYRWYLEQSAFNLPWETFNEVISWNTLPVGVSALSELLYEVSGVPIYFISDAYDDEGFWHEWYYSQTKDGMYEEGDFKPFYHMLKTMPFLKSILLFSHPQASKAGYEYFREKNSNI